MDELNYRMLDEACEAAGVELGAYDHRILAWVAQYEPQMCAVIAGIIRRAAQPPEGTETKWALRIDRAENFTVYDANTARRVMKMLKEHGTPVALYSCQIGPWTKASETEEEDDNAR